ncbi:MAG: hypothetical protein E6J91_11150 [Deltaproteobacteria bacterium]|nr:MAG: hypothetical protein E6J91_11150 [Deltaproteobacteria bacterium]
MVTTTSVAAARVPHPMPAGSQRSSRGTIGSSGSAWYSAMPRARSVPASRRSLASCSARPAARQASTGGAVPGAATPAANTTASPSTSSA